MTIAFRPFDRTENKDSRKYLKEDEQSRKEHYWMIAKLASLGIKKWKIMDVGCGGGFFLSRLSKTFNDNELYGIDISKPAISLAKKHTRANILLSSAEKLPLKNRSFDVVACQNLLHHLVKSNRFSSKQNVKCTLNEIRRVLKIGGYLLVIEQCVSSKALSRLIFVYTFILYILGRHRPISFLTPKEIYGILAGLILEKKEHVCMRKGLYKYFVRIYVAAQVK